MSPPLITPTERPVSSSKREVRLSMFIHWVLQQSYTQRFSPDVTLQLLDQAWVAQKLLWQLRRQSQT